MWCMQGEKAAAHTSLKLYSVNDPACLLREAALSTLSMCRVSSVPCKDKGTSY